MKSVLLFALSFGSGTLYSNEKKNNLHLNGNLKKRVERQKMS